MREDSVEKLTIEAILGTNFGFLPIYIVGLFGHELSLSLKLRGWRWSRQRKGRGRRNIAGF